MKIFQSLPYMCAPNTGAKFTSWQQNIIFIFLWKIFKILFARVAEKV